MELRQALLVRLAGALALAAAAFLLLPGHARASQQIDNDGTHVRIQIDGSGRALVSYLKHGARKTVLASGAIDALAPTASGKQVEFALDYDRYHANGFKGTCGRYDGPKLPYLAAACKAPDGSYWAVQEWPKALPDLGYEPWLPAQRAHAMDLSHWRGAVARLVAYPDWTYSGTTHSLFGNFTYAGKPVYGFHTTAYGMPTDGFGRLIYVDTYGSAHGAGWVRENSFVSHNPTGVFCYGFYSFDPTRGGYLHPPGQTSPRGPDIGSTYRLTGIGPGVTPDVQTTVEDPGDFDKGSTDDVAFRLKEWRLLSTFIGSDQACRKGRALGAVNLNVVDSWFSHTPNGDPVTSFELGDPVYFNVRFDRPLSSPGGQLSAATAKWVNHNSFNYGAAEYKQPTVTVSSDGLTASAYFGLKGPNNRRYTGTWTATMTVSGLQVAAKSIDASLRGGTYVNLSQPTISGSVAVGSTLTATPGTWNFAPLSVTYSWARCPPTGGNCVNLGDGPSYTVTAADLTWPIDVFVDVTDPDGKHHGGMATTQLSRK